MSTRLTRPILEKVDLQSIDEAIQTMIANDNKIIPSYGITPKVWCCRWYNGSKRNLYSKGQAVWLNTEDLDEFTTAHKKYILNVIQNNSTLRNIYKKLNGDEGQIYQLCKDVVTGDVTGNSQGLPLYCIGDILKKTQIRVSTVDNNDTLPTDDSCWKDFFVNNDESKFQLSVMQRTAELCEQYLAQHLVDYHLSGIYDYWLSSEGVASDLEDFFLKNDMSNLDSQYEYSSDAGTKQKGIDYVLYFNDKKYNDTCWKWFRVWSSGLLEHGGVVDTRYAETCEDSLVFTDADGNPTHYKVNLSWSGSGGTTPTFSYSRSGSGFCNDGSCIDVGDGQKIQIDSLGKQISQDDHYCVQITPITNGVIPYQNMNSSGSTVQTYWYMSKDVDCMENSSFRFLLNKEATTYAYHVQGFVRNLQQRYK